MYLKDELNAEKGSFLLELRSDFNWNHHSFINLLSELNTECIRIKETKTVSRETASGIWYISYFIKSWSSHQNFPKKQSKIYYEKTYELINDLAFYYFMGVSPYQSEQEINSKILELSGLYVVSWL